MDNPKRLMLPLDGLGMDPGRSTGQAVTRRANATVDSKIRSLS